jgi:hypothetical protein
VATALTNDVSLQDGVKGPEPLTKRSADGLENDDGQYFILFFYLFFFFCMQLPTLTIW